MTYVFSSRGYKRAFDYFGDTHPTEGQYKVQKWLAGWNPLYDGWIRGRATDELAQSNRNALGVKWSDIKNPWVASLAGGSEASSIGRAFSTVSTNLAQHYTTYRGYKERQKRDRERRERIRKSKQKRPYHVNKPWWMERY